MQSQREHERVNRGRVVTCGSNHFRQCDVPEADVGVRYIQVAAGLFHTVLLRSDGRVVACGSNDDAECDVPEAV